MNLDHSTGRPITARLIAPAVVLLLGCTAAFFIFAQPAPGKPARTADSSYVKGEKNVLPNQTVQSRNPPIDAAVPAAIETATFALG